MTDKEKAIIMAHTGICMLTGDKFQIFHKYIEDVMGRPVMTHEIGFLADEIKEKTKADFIELCANESSLENPNKWIPCSERLPEENGFYLVTYDGEICGENESFTGLTEYENGKWVDDEEDYQCVLAWMPLPEPYKAEMESEK